MVGKSSGFDSLAGHGFSPCAAWRDHLLGTPVYVCGIRSHLQGEGHMYADERNLTEGFDLCGYHELRRLMRQTPAERASRVVVTGA